MEGSPPPDSSDTKGHEAGLTDADVPATGAPESEADASVEGQAAAQTDQSTEVEPAADTSEYKEIDTGFGPRMRIGTPPKKPKSNSVALAQISGKPFINVDQLELCELVQTFLLQLKDGEV